MSREEKAALALLVTLGATALDCQAAEVKLKEFENRFGVCIDTHTITSVIKKVGGSLSGSETVDID